MCDFRALFPLQLARGTEKELIIAGILLILVLVTSIVWPGLYTFLPAGLLVVLFALLLYFFRDPKRTPPAGGWWKCSRCMNRASWRGKG